MTLSNIRMNFIQVQTTKQKCHSVKPDPFFDPFFCVKPDPFFDPFFLLK